MTNSKRPPKVVTVGGINRSKTPTWLNKKGVHPALYENEVYEFEEESEELFKKNLEAKLDELQAEEQSLRSKFFWLSFRIVYTILFFVGAAYWIGQLGIYLGWVR